MKTVSSPKLPPSTLGMLRHERTVLFRKLTKSHRIYVVPKESVQAWQFTKWVHTSRSRYDLRDSVSFNRVTLHLPLKKKNTHLKCLCDSYGSPPFSGFQDSVKEPNLAPVWLRKEYCRTSKLVEATLSLPKNIFHMIQVFCQKSFFFLKIKFCVKTMVFILL